MEDSWSAKDAVQETMKTRQASKRLNQDSKIETRIEYSETQDARVKMISPISKIARSEKDISKLVEMTKLVNSGNAKRVCKCQHIYWDI